MPKFKWRSCAAKQIIMDKLLPIPTEITLDAQRERWNRNSAIYCANEEEYTEICISCSAATAQN